MSRDTLICLALACLTTVLYAPVRHHEFVNFDDPGYVNEPHVREGLSIANARWAFTTLHFANYHPLTWLSHMADVTVFGRDNAGAHHVTNVLLHACNAALVYLVLNALTGRPWASLAVAALWTTHPLRVESVAWVAERKDLLSGLFFLLAIGCYARYARRTSRSAYAGSLACFVLGLMSKAMVVTLPGVLLLLDAWPLRRTELRWRRLVVEKLPFVAISAASAVVTYVAQQRYGAMSAGEQIGFGLRAGNAFASLASYLRLTVWPTSLAVVYPYYGAVRGTMLSPASVAAGVALLIGGIVIGLACWRRERAVLVGWLWFLGTLVPVLGLVQVGRQSMADRYTYLPHVGLMIAIVWGVAAAAGRLNVPRAALAATLAAVLVALSARTVDQVRHWRNSETLFAHALDVTHHNAVAHGSLALALGDRGDVAAAVEHYQRAIEITPQEPQLYYNIGQLYLVAGDYVRAQEWLGKALRLDPNYADAHSNLAKAFAGQGRAEHAIEQFREVARLRPDSYVAHYDLAVELAEHGDLDEALDHFAEAARLKPDSPQVWYSRSLALSRAGRAAEAESAYKTHLELSRQQGVDPLPMPTTNPHNP
jgi:tetratricopeptide (TPR) repeat protein